MAISLPRTLARCVSNPMSYCILHVDDDPDIRAVVELSLSLDPSFAVTSCASGDHALAIASAQAPDLILCDVMMPGMDGPAVLARLRENDNTAKTPVVFMTARAQTSEIEHFKSLGAAAVITKPFDPMKLADVVRGHLRSDDFAAVEDAFVQRLRRDAILLAKYRDNHQGDADLPGLLENIQSCAHKLAGAAGVYNFQTVSAAASRLEETIIERRAGHGASGSIETNIDALLDCIEQNTAAPG